MGHEKVIKVLTQQSFVGGHTGACDRTVHGTFSSLSFLFTILVLSGSDLGYIFATI